jgi:hypothetical protein
MERQARSPIRSAPEQLGDGRSCVDDRPLSDLEAVVWREPLGWESPDWLRDAPCPPSLPMTYPRMQWCIHVIGWPIAELARRIHMSGSSVKQMQCGRQAIPDSLAIWLEMLTARMLNAPLLPHHWRGRPLIEGDGVPTRNQQDSPSCSGRRCIDPDLCANRGVCEHRYAVVT